MCWEKRDALVKSWQSKYTLCAYLIQEIAVNFETYGRSEALTRRKA